MRANRANTIEAPRKSGGAFFRWETPGEPVAVHFQLNIVDLLERDLGYGPGKGRSGILLGRIECGRKLTLIVEDYESTSGLARASISNPPLKDHDLLGKMVEQWSSKSEKRISILGFYRTCAHGKIAITGDDLKISGAHLTEPERLFLLIEPQVATISKATLYMLRDGAVAWQWHSVPFNREKLAEERNAVRPSTSALAPRPSAPKPQKAHVTEKLPAGSQAPKVVKASTGARWAIGIATAIAVVSGGIYSLRGTGTIRELSESLKPSGDSSALGLKIQRVGSDWQLSWNPNAPVFLKASAGRLVITDGFIHRTLDLDMSGLRSGNIMYTPASDDATIRLEVVNAESKMLADGTVRMVAGMLPPIPAALKNVGSPQDNHLHAAKIIPTTSTPNPSGPSSSIAHDSLSTKTTIPFNLSSPNVAPRHEGAKIDEPVTQTVIPVPQYTASAAPQPILPTALPAAGSGANASTLASSSRFVSHSTTLDMIKPAELISRRDPIYPQIAKMSHVTGTVELQFRVSATGRTEDVTVVRGTPALVPAAVEAVKSWRYKPAQIKGAPVVSAVSTTIVFKLN